MTPAAAGAWLVRPLTVAGLGIDAAIHADLAPDQPPGGHITQTAMFYFEAGAAGLAALLVLISATRLTYAVAFAIAVSALGAVVLYRYVDVGPLGPLPDMYEPFWYPSKVATTVAEAVAVITAAIGTVLMKPLGGLHANSGVERR